MIRSLELIIIVTFIFLCDELVLAGRMLRFASPLQTLTIPDREVRPNMETKRQKFLPKFRAGLKAETEARKELALKRTMELQASSLSGSDWVERTADSERARKAKEDEFVEKAYDKAVAEFKESSSSAGTNKKKSTTKIERKQSYQFVGVVNRHGMDKQLITWYARKKPADAKWSVRLVHVNQDAIIKDLFNRGKVDIFAKYKNTGLVDEETNSPIVTAKYEVRERSWKNLWNFSPKHFFTDSSGMYWRERRLQPGLYTDGVSVYESSYRYSDGRNGMHRISGLPQFLSSKNVKAEQKERIMKRLKEDTPDIVLEL